MKSLILEKVNGQAEQLLDWSQINWVTVNKLIRNLQRRIFRARKLGQWKQLRRLQKLLNKSYANLRHTKKKLKWVKDKYFRRIKGVDWTFCCETEDRKGKKNLLCLYNIAKTPIVRHIKVKGTASPFDAELKEYWSKRRTKLGKSKWAKGSKYETVAKQQNWKCPNCGQSLFNGENIETHHIVPVKIGGSDDTENLIHLHGACHKQEHSKTKYKA